MLRPNRSLPHWRLLLALFAFGLLVRLCLLWQTSDLETRIGDEQQYVQLANSILSGDGLAWGPGRPTSLRPPLYPALVAAVWSVAGAGNLQAVRLVQVGMALLLSWLVFELGRRAFNDTVGAWAAVVVWLYPTLVFFNFTILTETLFTLLLTAFVLLAVMLAQQPGPLTAFACGLVLGLGALTRSVLWPLPLLLCPLLLLLITAPLGRRVLFSGILLVGYAMVIAPWTVRNTQLQGVLTIVDTMGGMNLRMGNYEHTPEDRMWDAVTVAGDRNWAYALTQERLGASSPITEAEKEKWAQRKAVEYMVGNPGTTLRRAAIKFGDFWGLERSFIAGLQQGVYAPPLWFGLLASGLVLLSCATVLVMAVAGISLAPPDWRVHVLLLLPILVLAAVHTIVFGHSRYHVPLVPLLALYAVSAARLPRSALLGHRRPWLLAGAGLSVLLLLGIWVRHLLVVDGEKIRSLLDSLR